MTSAAVGVLPVGVRVRVACGCNISCKEEEETTAPTL